MVSHPETGSDPPIGSNRETGCDRSSMLMFPLSIKVSTGVQSV